MELLDLLCSIISTTITSLIISFLFPFRHLLRRISTSKLTDGSVALYEGPVHHSFRYSVSYALIDLDASVNAQLDHFSPDEARRLADTNGPVYLLTIPRSVGYDQNPLSVYHCYDIEGSCRTLKKF